MLSNVTLRLGRRKPPASQHTACRHACMYIYMYAIRTEYVRKRYKHVRREVRSKHKTGIGVSGMSNLFYLHN